MERKALFTIHDTFNITGRGLVIAGQIEEGDISVGNVLEFVLNGATKQFAIKGIDILRRNSLQQQDKWAFLLSCTEKEAEELRSNDLSGIPAIVFHKSGY